jgi:hypothetical protein
MPVNGNHWQPSARQFENPAKMGVFFSIFRSFFNFYNLKI